MIVIYRHIEPDVFGIVVPEWTEVMSGMTWDATRHNNGERVSVLAGQNERGPIQALFQVEEWGMYHYFRNLCGYAPDFDTQALVVKQLIHRLDEGYKVLAKVKVRSQFRMPLIDGDIVKVLGIHEDVVTARKEIYMQVARPISLIEGSRDPAMHVELIREVNMKDLYFQNVYLPNPATDMQPMAQLDSDIN